MKPAADDAGGKLRDRPSWPFAFDGAAWSYYRIYIVSLLLTLVTLGAYSAWAKVRKQRFFYGGTTLHGSRFAYDAKPLAILASRAALAALLIAAAAVDSAFGLLWQGIGLLSSLLLLLAPIAHMHGRAFNARHTLYAGVRFAYRLNYGPAYRILLLYYVPALVPLLVLNEFVGSQAAQNTTGQQAAAIAAGFALWYAFVLSLMPLWDLARHRLRINQLECGGLRMSYAATAKQYYAAYLRALPVLLAFAALTLWVAYNPFTGERVLPTMLPMLLAWQMAYRAGLARIYWNAVNMSDGGRLRASFSAPDYFVRIMLANLLIVVLSLGVLLPLARVRKWRYLARSLSYVPGAERDLAQPAGRSAAAPKFTLGLL